MTVRLITLIAGAWAIADSTYAMWHGLAVHPIVICVVGFALVWNAIMGPAHTELF